MADFWWVNAPSWSEDAPSEVETWHTHSPYERRYYSFACLFYGADPEAREAFATDMDLPKDRQETCPSEFELMAKSWDHFLKPIAGSEGTVTFEARTAGYDYIATALADEIAYMNDRMALPRPLSVVLAPCGEANAFYQSEDASVIICTELVDEAIGVAEGPNP